MGNVRIDLPDNLHRNLKRRTIDEDMPMRDLLIKALQEYIENNPPLLLEVTSEHVSERTKRGK